MTKRILSLAITLILVLAVVPVSAAEPEAGPEYYAWIVLPAYDDVMQFTGDLIPVATGDRDNGYKWGLVDKTGKKLTAVMYDLIELVSDDLAAVATGDPDKGFKWGLIGAGGNEIIPLRYNSIDHFFDGMAVVCIGGPGAVKYGYIDMTGVETISPVYEYANEFHNGLALVLLKGEWGFIDKTGKSVLPYSNGMAPVNVNGKWGTIDEDGNEIFAPKYDNPVYIFSEGLAAAAIGGKWGFIDEKGQVAVPLKYDSAGNFSDGMAIVSLNGKWGYIDKSGKEIIPPIYNWIPDFSETLAAVPLDGKWENKWGFINKSGEVIIPYKYDWAGDFTDGLAVVRVDGKYGYINKSDNVVIPPEYARATGFSEGVAAVAAGSRDSGYKYGFIDKSGKQLTPFLFDAVSHSSGAITAVGLIGPESSGNMKWGLIAVGDPLSTASDWARVEILSAIAKGFVPLELQNNYQNVITRIEFCRIAIRFVEYAAGADIDELLAKKGVSRNPNTFSDTGDRDVLAAFALGIINGTSAPTDTTPGTFTPGGRFDRQQAATLIMNVCIALGMDAGNTPPSGFTDIGKAADWAVAAIDFCFANGIMQGTGNNTFSPTDLYSRQQSIVTFDRIKIK